MVDSVGAAAVGRQAVRRGAGVRRWRRWWGPALLGAVVVLGIAAPWVAPYGLDEQDLSAALQGPSGAHWLGTDELGRDIFSRLLYGIRPTTLLPLAGVGAGALVGVAMGVVGGYRGGLADNLLLGLTEVVLTFPSIVLAVVVVSLLGVGERSLVAAVAAASLPGPARIARASVLAVRGMEYVEASRAAGATDGRLILRHILPNILPPVIVQVTIELSQAVLLSAALGFLGLGVQPPAPEWGTMLSQARGFVHLAPHMMFFPGLAIALLVLGLNATGDVLRDRLDPTLRKGKYV